MTKRFTPILPLLFLSALLLAATAQIFPATALAASHEGAEMTSEEGSACEDWKARHEEMMAKMAEMDQRLDDLVARMNEATGDAKVDAVAAVVNELVSQRAEMRAKMKAKHGHKHWKKCGGDCKACGKCEDCPKAGKCEGCPRACAGEEKSTD